MMLFVRANTLANEISVKFDTNYTFIDSIRLPSDVESFYGY